MAAAAKMCWASVELIKLELGVTCVYNADQSGICFEYLPKRTLNSSGEKTVWVRCSSKDKERFTGMFLADSDGNQYPPFFVLRTISSKTTTPPKTTRLLAAALELGFIYGNRSGWWNSKLTVEFLDYHFADRSTDEPVLLLDDFSAHWTDAAAAHAQDLNVFLLRVPPGLTSVRQPADVAWFGPMKRRLREEWVQFLMHQLRVYDGRAIEVPFRLQPPSRLDAITWACKALSELGFSVVKSGFKRHERVEEESEQLRDELVERLQSLFVVDEVMREGDDVVVDVA